MSNANTLSTADHQTLQSLLAALPEPQALAALPDCNTYKTYRPILQTALPLVKLIPVYGGKIYNAISFLLSMADSVCNIPATPAGLDAGAGSGKFTVQKVSDTEVLVKLPAGTQINANSVSEADLYAALSRNLLKPAGGLGTADCIAVVGPICIID